MIPKVMFLFELVGVPLASPATNFERHRHLQGRELPESILRPPHTAFMQRPSLLADVLAGRPRRHVNRHQVIKSLRRVSRVFYTFIATELTG